MDLAETVRSEFPAIVECSDYVFGDAPTGTQCHRSVSQAMHDYMNRPGAHLMGHYPGALNTQNATTKARVAAAAFFNAKPEEITFGPNMTSLTFHMARSLEDHIKTLPSFPHLNVILSQLCHDANVSPWLRLAENLDGLEVRRLDFNRKSCTIDQSDFDRKLDSKTVLVCLGLASNACGTINPVKQMIKQVRATAPQALIYVDAVHYAPHMAIDVQDLDCDFCVCSTFKFFGPHCGMLFGKSNLMRTLRPYKLSVCADTLPGPPHPNQFQRWETGTLNFEGLAGIGAVIEYIASIGDRFPSKGDSISKNESLRKRIVAGYEAMLNHEAKLTKRFLAGVSNIPGLKIYGNKDLDSTLNGKRTPTFALRMNGLKTAGELADQLLEEKIICGAGHFYAKYFAEGLGLMPTGGYVRVGFAHYNTLEEIDRVIEVLVQISKACNFDCENIDGNWTGL